MDRTNNKAIDNTNAVKAQKRLQWFLDLYHRSEYLGDKEEIETFGEVKALVKKYGSIDDQGYIKLYYGDCCRRRGWMEEAEREYAMALSLFQKTGNQKGIAEVYAAIGIQHYSTGDYVKAIETHLLALNLSIETGNLKGIGNAYCNIGICYARQSDYAQAFKYLELSIKPYHEANMPRGEAQVRGNIGMIHFLMGNYAAALNNLIEQLHINERIGNREVSGNAYLSMGSIYLIQENFSESVKYYVLAKDIFKDINLKAGIASSDMNLGIIHFKQSKYNEATGYFLQALQIFREIGDKQGEANVLHNWGNNQIAMNELNAALQNHLKSIHLFEQVGDQLGPIATGVSTGNAYFKLGDTETALKYLEKSYKAAECMNLKEQVKEASDALSKIYRSVGNFEKALIYYEKYHLANSEMLGEQAQKQLTNLNFQHNLEQKEKEAEINRLKYVELEDKNKQIAAEKEEAEKQRNRAEQSERFKQMFLANMSHEIRTPMNAIVGMTNLLLTESQSEKNLRYLNAIKHSSDTLLVVINDVLDLSKIEAGKLKLEEVPFNLYQQLELMREIFELKTQEKKLQLKIAIDPAVPRHLIGDPHRLTQVLINLVGNAVKFTQKGSISLSIEIAAKNQYRFAIKDTGIGISADKLNSIFESFTQAESDTTRQYGGTGLGLTISQKLVELMGSKITVHSKAGKGSEFSFIVSLKQAKTGAIVPVKNKTGQLTKQLNGISILLAEDNAYNQVVAVDTLKKFIPKCEIAIAKNGKEVLQKLKAKDFDIILMDLHMPHMDGYEASQHIRKDFAENKKHIPILALTASVIRADIDRCLKSGMNGYVSKPFSPGQLIDEIYKQLGNKSAGIRKKQAHVSKVKKPVKGTAPDTSYLEEFADGNTKNMKKYIGIFLRSAPAQLKKAERAVNKGDVNALYAALHTIKPQLKFMGLPSMLLKTEQLEIRLRKDSKINKLITKMVNTISQEVTITLKKWEAYKFALTK